MDLFNRKKAVKIRIFRRVVTFQILIRVEFKVCYLQGPLREPSILYPFR